MIKKYNTYINEANDEELTPVLKIALRQNIPFDEIEILHCFNEALTSLDGIEKLVNLKQLYYSHNELTSLHGIEKLVNLTFLDCAYNKLTNLNGIENLVNLKFLRCYNNKLTSLHEIENLYNLKYVNCRNNNLSKDYKKYLKDYYDTLNLMIPNKEDKIKLDI